MTGNTGRPIQVCPRGCSHEAARRDVVARTRISGRVKMHIDYSFETTNCGVCGAPFESECGRCGQAILSPVRDRCDACGLPHPWATERRTAAKRSQPRQWKPGSKKTEVFAVPILGDRAVGELYVIEGDITTFDVEAVVSNDDVDGRMWAAVASSIKAAAGADVEARSVARGPFPLGHAWYTYSGADLPAKEIVHVASMDTHGKSSGIETIRTCVRAALDLAVGRELASLAIATIGTGTQAIPLGDWLNEVTAEISDFLMSSKKSLDVLVVLYECPDFDARVDQIREASMERRAPQSLWQRVRQLLSRKRGKALASARNQSRQ